MGLTAAVIASRALVLIGEQPIASLQERTTAAAVVRTLYEDTVQGLLAQKRWGFARRTLILSRRSAAPDDGIWPAAYAKPADWLETQGCFIHGRPIEFEEFEGEIRCHATATTQVVMKYIARVPEGVWPASFVQAVVHELAAVIAFPLTAQESVQGTRQRIADRTLQRARTTNAQGQTTPRLPVSRFRRNRGSSPSEE